MALANTIRSVLDLIKRLSAPIREAADSSSTSSASEVDADLEKVAASLSGALPVLLDGAEESEDKAQVKLWIRELKCVAYDAEDVLDEFQFDMQLRRCAQRSLANAAVAARNNKRKKHTQQGGGRLPAYPSPPSSFATRIREIRERLDVIQSERNSFSLGEGEGARRAETAALPRLPSAAAVDESRVYGRDGDVKEVVEMLLSGDDQKGEHFSVASIVGMPGLGKTTLAQMVYRDERVVKHFQVRSWVHVSDKFDVARLTRAILESMMRKRVKHNVELSLLQGILKDELTEKRFLLLLDDVWCEQPSQWEAFKMPLTSSGARGSRVLITTRVEAVAKALGSRMIHHLDVLSQGDCWSLFSHYAFRGQSPPDANPCLIEIGKQIVKKCDGHPFTVRTLGGLLQYETDEGTWRQVLGSEIWELSGDGDRCILPGLKLSYTLLPGSLKQCLSYCAVIPKAWNFERGQLVRMWAAQGFLRPQDEEQTHDLEDVAYDCFDDLVQRSFFQHSQKDWSDVVKEEEEGEMFMMHDLIHDMLKTISMDEYYCSAVEEEGRRNMFSISPNARHSSVVCSSILALSKFQSICPKSLRTFLLMELKDELNTNLLGKLFLKLLCLRVLDLSFANINELPDSVGDLKHLRYLGLNGTNITRLPESVGGLYNLQTLESLHCELEELPRSLGDLVNLRHFVHQNNDYATTSLSMMPPGIGKLTCLRTLPIFVVSKEPGSASVGELKDLNELRGALFIVRLHSAADGVASTREANMKGKKHLEMLLLEWGKGDENIDEEMLENLEPHTNLKELKLDYNYRGFRIPRWMGDPSFSNLETVTISDCINCERLPPLGQLPSLRFLSICEMRRVEHVGSEFFGGGAVRGFPSLLALHFRDMPEWKHWWTQCESEEEGDTFPLLRDITLDGCPKLGSVSLHNLTSLQALTIKNCAELASVDCLSICCMAAGRLQREHAASFLERLEFRRCPKLEFSSQERLPSSLQRFHIHRCRLLKEWSQAHRDQLASVPELRVTGEELSIHEVALKSRAIGEELKLEEGLQKLELGWYLGKFDYEDEPEEVLAGLEPHTNLRELVIDGYRGSNFAAWLGDPSFSHLVKIILKNCQECTSLPPLGKLPSLKELHISTLLEVQYIGHEFSDGGFPSLEILQFQDMPQWKAWKVRDVEGAMFPCLRDLNISRCPKLEGLSSALTKMKSSKFKLRLQQFDDVMILRHLQNLCSTCTTLCISQFPNLRELPYKWLPRNLKELEIEGCNRLKALSHLPAGVRGLVLTACNERILCSPRSFSPFSSLSYLWICRFLTLKTLPLIGSLPSLKELCISTCPELVSLSCPGSSTSSSSTAGLSMPASLRLLSITDCPTLEFSPEEQLPSFLQYVHISGCQLVAEWCQKHWSKVSHVSKLWIDGVLISANDDQQTGDGLITSMEEAISSIRNNMMM